MQYIPIFLEAAKAGAEVLRKYFGESLEATTKTTGADLQTKADLESEAAILPILEKAFPTFDILSEERGHTVNGSEYTIVVDPLDGTNNFVAGLPNFTILIALLHNKRAIAGLIYFPMLNSACYAEEDRGAFFNEARIHVNSEADSSRSAVAYVPGYTNSARETGRVMNALNAELNIKRVHYNWSGAGDGAMLARGRIEAMMYDGNQIYDYAASKVICREAGAKITLIDGSPELGDMGNVFLVSNATDLHEKILTSWRKVRTE